MTMIILVNEIDPAHLAEVKSSMLEMGSPTIRAIDAGDHLIAVEGSHRIQAAQELGLPVNVEILDEAGEIDLNTLDWDDCGWFDDRVVPVLEFIEGFTRSPFPMSAATAEIEVNRIQRGEF